ncbi:MAG: hypothetical protein HDR88_07900 [Bacteroides sp.]|nr:hypothetical protein [Bacteroides sp.]
MKTNFTKIGFACLVAGMAFSTASADKMGNIEFPGFTKRIEGRQPAKEVNARVLPQDPTVALKKAAQRPASRFIGWNAENPSLPNMMAKSAEAGEKMDSVVGVYLTGDLMSKQTFEFTENGSPLVCSNYVPAADGKYFQYSGHFAYEYDAEDRVISAEKVEVNSLSSCQRIEYGYTGDSRAYNLQIAYLMDEEGEWTPFQKGEYQLDINGNTTEELYSYWSDEVNDWVPVMKNVATYDEMSRLTSYFPYVWDANANDWVGDTEGYYGGQEFEYTQNGDDALNMDYEWIDGEWVPYFKAVFTYNDAALMIRKDRLYWNREKQDWSGAETWGPWGDMKYNQYETYDYDEYGRGTETNVFTSASGEYVNYYRATTAYSVLENGDTEKIEMSGSVKDDVYAPYAKNIQHINKFGSETYYISYRESDGEWIPQQEEFRYLDEYNWFLGGDYYNYFNGERKPSSKERFYYPDDFDPTLPYETPYEGRHWVGGGSEEDGGWRLKHVDNFTWGPRDVMIGYVNYDYIQSDGNKTTGWEMEYDFTANTANIFMWPDSNKGKPYYENKTIEAITYNNYQYWDGNDEWQPEYSYKFNYFYSPRTSTGINSVAVPEGVLETERYDLMSRPLTEPTTGINIVRYSDGSSRKVMVK